MVVESYSLGLGLIHDKITVLVGYRGGNGEFRFGS